jgi:uncharacterized membrane protein
MLVTVIDLIWGAAVSGATSALGYAIVSRL